MRLRVEVLTYASALCVLRAASPTPAPIVPLMKPRRDSI
jgi:hypothetical protein